MRILFLIARQFNLCLKTKLALQSNYDNSKIASVIKVPPFAVKKYSYQLKKYNGEKLKNILNTCLEIDEKSKSASYNAKCFVASAQKELFFPVLFSKTYITKYLLAYDLPFL